MVGKNQSNVGHFNWNQFNDFWFFNWYPSKFSRYWWLVFRNNLLKLSTKGYKADVITDRFMFPRIRQAASYVGVSTTTPWNCCIFDPFNI